MTVVCTSSCLMRLSSSMPSISGMRRSVITSFGRCSTIKRCASLPEATSSTEYPASASCICSTRRTLLSSSTMRIELSAMTNLLAGRKFDSEDRSAAWITVKCQCASMLRNDHGRDCEAKSSAFRLGGEERLKNLIGHVDGNAAPAVLHLDHNLIVFRNRSKIDRRAYRRRLYGIQDEIEQHLA